jgi:general secretion pathway protein G
MKKAFSFIELIFVIVILGILATIAVPKLFATRTDAQIAKARADISTIRSAIENFYTTNLMKGVDAYPSVLDTAQQNKENEKLFEGDRSKGEVLLNYPIYSKNANGHWMKVGDTNYTIKIMNIDVKFNYDNQTGNFDCNGYNFNEANTTCIQLTH